VFPEYNDYTDYAHSQPTRIPMAHTPASPRSTKRVASYAEHLNIIDNFIAHEAGSMAAMNDYIEKVSHPSTTFGLIIDARDHVRKALRTLQAARLVIASYEEDSAV
jgi:hypothetical protein